MSTGSGIKFDQPQPAIAYAAPVVNLVAAVDATSAASPQSLLEKVLHVGEGDACEVDRLQSEIARFKTEGVPQRLVCIWFGLTPETASALTHGQMRILLERDIASIDRLLSEQVNAILHHERFQQLESSWRGLAYLVDQTERALQVNSESEVVIKLLHATWRDVNEDFEQAVDFDQSALFQKVYTEELGTPGGRPFGLLIGDYALRHRSSAEHPYDDVSAIRAISQVAAASFCPFVTGVDPALLGLRDFAPLGLASDLIGRFEQAEYLKWNAFRATDDARFVGLSLPRVLGRLPYENDGSRVDNFVFREDVEGPDARKCLWTNSAFCFASVVVRTFAQNGWMADIRGFRRVRQSDDDHGSMTTDTGVEIAGGIVANLPTYNHRADAYCRFPLFPTDVRIADTQEKQLEDLGFMPLMYSKDTEYCVYYTSQSAQKPRVYQGPDKETATANAKISAMLQYVLCASRFAHYLKIAARDRIGSFLEADELQDELKKWLVEYVSSSADDPERPLAFGDVRVREVPGRPGTFACTMDLEPHFQLDALSARLTLTTKVVKR